MKSSLKAFVTADNIWLHEKHDWDNRSVWMQQLIVLLVTPVRLQNQKSAAKKNSVQLLHFFSSGQCSAALL